MVTDKHNLKIDFSIVQAIFILMVYILVGSQFSAKNFFHDDAMFISPLSVLTFYLPVVLIPAWRPDLAPRTYWNPPGIGGYSRKSESATVGRVIPITKSSASLRAILTFFVNPDKVNREWFVASLTAAKKYAAFFADESFHVSILHQTGKTCQVLFQQ